MSFKLQTVVPHLRQARVVLCLIAVSLPVGVAGASPLETRWEGSVEAAYQRGYANKTVSKALPDRQAVFVEPLRLVEGSVLGRRGHAVLTAAGCPLVAPDNNAREP